MKRTPLRRKTAIRRGSKPMKRTRLKRVNAKRKRQRFERAFLSREYVGFVHSLGCAVPGCDRLDIGCAHVERTRARGGRWFEVVPLCRMHHTEQEGRTAEMEAKHGVNLRALAARIAFDWKAFTREV